MDVMQCMQNKFTVFHLNTQFTTPISPTIFFMKKKGIIITATAWDEKVWQVIQLRSDYILALTHIFFELAKAKLCRKIEKFFIVGSNDQDTNTHIQCSILTFFNYHYMVFSIYFIIHKTVISNSSIRSWHEILLKSRGKL